MGEEKLRQQQQKGTENTFFLSFFLFEGRGGEGI